MIKRDKNFRLPKPIKRMLSGKLCKNPNSFKESMIEAQIIGSIVVKQPKKQKSDSKIINEE